MTIKAYELSEKYRTPVILLMDEVIGHMRERIELPDSYDEIQKPQRKVPASKTEGFLPYQADADGVPPMAPFGKGYHSHVTGLVHDESGFPNGSSQATQVLMDRLNGKVENNLDDIMMYEEYCLEDADIAVVAYGGTARTAYAAVDMARSQGIKAGLFRPITIWPFAEKQIQELAGKVKHILVAEMNCGQLVGEVKKAVEGKVPVELLAKYNNEAILPDEMLQAIANVKL